MIHQECPDFPGYAGNAKDWDDISRLATKYHIRRKIRDDNGDVEDTNGKRYRYDYWGECVVIDNNDIEVTFWRVETKKVVKVKCQSINTDIKSEYGTHWQQMRYYHKLPYRKSAMIEARAAESKRQQETSSTILKKSRMYEDDMLFATHLEITARSKNRRPFSDPKSNTEIRVSMWCIKFQKESKLGTRTVRTSVVIGKDGEMTGPKMDKIINMDRVKELLAKALK